MALVEFTRTLPVAKYLLRFLSREYKKSGTYILQ